MKMNTNVTSTKKGDIDAVIGTAVFSFTKEELWNRANRSYKFASHCINLDDFRTEDTLKDGNGSRTKCSSQDHATSCGVSCLVYWKCLLLKG